MDFLQDLDLTNAQWAVLALTAFFIGLSKTGIYGLGSVMVPVMAAAFGGKLSTGIVLPMLIMADLFGVAYYRRHGDWGHLLKLLPWAFAGIVIGTFVGHEINDRAFKAVMGVIVVVSVAIMFWQDRRRSAVVPDQWWFAALLGLAAGFTTMLGNLAGAVTALYLLTMRLPKNSFIGTSAWFFLAVNVFKVPFQVLFWGTVNVASLQLNLLTFPIIALGAVGGIWATKLLSEKMYRQFVMGITLASVVFLFL